ncbi:hypothetical protein BS47DRAFT_1347297 [Hydnum rufescens UP504]|uniref:Potassium transporter n=1 Tax=Hydnum rufescens UP504 TaxID=1448309 RepID=A0A9P6ASN6_9AGAM|nr:hypothetical protein BS47DRAFT_1347297 [Hydnum rufescens UP504]
MEHDLGRLKRKPVKATGVALALMVYQTWGVIYSDIGTSPLYVLNGIWPSSGPLPSKDDVIGGLSAIIWSLTILPLRFGTGEGEGGVFALFQGSTPKGQDYARGRTFLRFARWPLTFWGLFGTSLTLSDGIFTPAVSVTSAVGGLGVAKPSVLNQVTGISIGFLVALFVIQRFGTSRITAVFSPITFIWLALIGACGIVNITSYPGVWRAVDPSRAILWFVRTKQYDLLAGVLLAVTGCEAMFANLGQFNALSIQIGFGCWVYPCLILAYLGQGAKLITDGPNVISNVFYTTIPGGHNGALYWWLIASQALITATFSLTQQLINMKSLPPFALVYTSDTIQGQIYVPAINYTLGLVTIIVVAAFKNLSNLTNAYGFAVATVMFVTTSFIAIQIYIVKRGPMLLAIAFLLTFGFFDGLFFGAALKKVPHGAWVPLSIGCFLVIVMMFWTWAKGLEDQFEGKNRKNPRHFIVDSKKLKSADAQSVHKDVQVEELPSNRPANDVAEASDTQSDAVVDVFDGLKFVDPATQEITQLSRLPTCAIFHNLNAGRGVPHSFYAFLKQVPALPRVVIFLSVRVLPLPYVRPEDNYVVTKVRSIPGFYGVVYRVGYRDDFNPSTEEIVRLACDVEARADPANAMNNVAEMHAAARQTSRIIPHYDVISKRIEVGWATPILAFVRRFLIEEIYRRLAIMFPETGNWGVGNEKYV